MTPLEKADELIDKMYYVGRYDDKEDYNPAMAWERAKQCALMAVDEIINCDTYFKTLIDSKDFTEYWYNVQEEINKL